MYLYVRGFADNAKQIKIDLRGATKVVLNHLIEIWLYPNVVEQIKWKSEVAHALNDIPKLKGKHKYPSDKFIFKNSWDVYRDTINNRIEFVIQNIQETPIEFETSRVYDALEEYFVWISNRLSEKGLVAYPDIYTKIEKIRKEYFNL